MGVTSFECVVMARSFDLVLMVPTVSVYINFKTITQTLKWSGRARLVPLGRWAVKTTCMDELMLKVFYIIKMIKKDSENFLVPFGNI